MFGQVISSSFIVLLFGLQCLASYDSESKSSNDQMMDSGDMMNTMAKRQLVPLPRIGKRQTSLLPSPRIGRSDKSMPTGESMSSYGNENLIEPLDVQLRAAFIPRLGKRSNGARSLMEESNESVDSGNKFRQLVLIPGLGYRYFYPTLNQLTDIDMADAEDEEEGLNRQYYEKRTIPYTPRIGRAVFAPRIGKKATFVPRIG